MYNDENKSRWYTYKTGNTDYSRISRGMIDSYLKCPRCFYLQKKLGVKPPHIPFNLNIAVDNLLKKEFDHFREIQKSHPLMEEYGLKLLPYAHENLSLWRGDEEGNYYGSGYEHKPTMLEVCGQIDEIWADKEGLLYIVDFKATATKDDYKLTMDYAYNAGYKRQLEVYQWIFKQNGFNVSDTAYIVFANGQTDNDKFANKLEFKLSIEKVNGDCSWVEPVLFDIKKCLDSDVIPESAKGCDYCAYFYARDTHEN